MRYWGKGKYRSEFHQIACKWAREAFEHLRLPFVDDEMLRPAVVDGAQVRPVGEFVGVNRGRGGNYIPQGPHGALQHNQVHAGYLIPSLDTCCSCAVAVTLWPLAQLWPPLLGNNSRRLPENSRRTLQLRTLGHRNQLFALAAGKQWFFNSQFRVSWQFYFVGKLKLLLLPYLTILVIMLERNNSWHSRKALLF